MDLHKLSEKQIELTISFFDTFAHHNSRLHLVFILSASENPVKLEDIGEVILGAEHLLDLYVYFLGKGHARQVHCQFDHKLYKEIYL